MAQNSPVNLLIVVSKVFEKVISNRFLDYLDQDAAFCLTVVSDRLARDFNKSGATRSAALDISKSFDRV